LANATQHIIAPDNVTDEGKIYISPFGMAGIQSVRLDGIDAPELKKEGRILEKGNKSRNFLDYLCEKKKLCLTYSRKHNIQLKMRE
jgi:endonuclease YncB( thermonuclease family)